MQDNMIIYEQPLNEHVRACLRLEYLFRQALDNMQGTSEWQLRTALAAILEAVNVIDRPDLKTKFAKVLTQHANLLAQLEEKPQVDREKLLLILNELDQLTDSLYRTPEKIGHSLRNNSFLSNIRQHMANPAGTSPFSTPAYYLWLKRPVEDCQRDLKNWLNEFDQLSSVVKLILSLTRQSISPVPVVAESGFYQQSLDSNINYQLIQIKVPFDLQVYPEVSAGKHRLTVRFLNLNLQDRPTQSEKNIPFDLMCCLLMGANQQV